MTAQEENSIRLSLSLDVDRAERELTFRRAEERRLAANLREIADVLDRDSAVQISGEDCLAVGPPTQLLPELSTKPILDYSALIAALTETKKARLKAYAARQTEALVRGFHGINQV
ncbi:MAG TPA: hypothetical protein VKR52_13865 [Terracidiphilus sp.]|nr:hypothetical protein [Terracidiphilus sp.]